MNQFSQLIVDVSCIVSVPLIVFVFFWRKKNTLLKNRLYTFSIFIIYWSLHRFFFGENLFLESLFRCNCCIKSTLKFYCRLVSSRISISFGLIVFLFIILSLDGARIMKGRQLNALNEHNGFLIKIKVQTMILTR